MAGSCNIYAQVLNSKGEVVDSRLFKDLLHYTSNDRELTKKLYKVSMDAKFKSLTADKAQFDENGEITLKSFLKLTNTSLNNEQLLQKLNTDIGSGVYDYQDAIQRLQNFNKNNPFNDRYLATITSIKGQYRLSVVKRNSHEENKLNNVISNQSLQDRIISTLAKHGVAVDFLKDSSEHSRYSTENAKRTADGLYYLIRIANGENLTEELCEEAGHFAIGALGSSPLVERLVNLLSPEVQREALGSEEYDNKYLGKDARREVAGTLVGRALASNIDKQSGWAKLVNRIADLAKRVFYNIKGDDIRLARLNAEKLADSIARGFMSPNFEGSIQTALETQETLYSADYSENVKAYKKVLDQLKLASAEFKAMNSSLGTIFDNIIADVQSNGREQVINKQIGILSDAKALEGITEALDLLVDLMNTEIPTLLDSVDFNNTQDFIFNMSRNGHTLHEAHIATKRCFEIMQVINYVTDSSTGSPRLTSPNGLANIQMIDPNTGNVITKNLIQLNNTLAKFADPNTQNSFYSQLRSKEAQFFLKFLEDSYGKTFIERGARVLFNWGNWRKKGKPLIEYKEGKTIKLETIMTDLEGDISIFDRFLGSMSNSSDVVSQIVDRVTKQANKQADDITNDIWNKLKALQNKLKEIGHTDTEIFYERDGDGNLTGNIISERNWGVWEREHDAFMKEEKEKFLKQHEVSPGVYDFDDKTEFEKALLWNTYFKPLNKSWHKNNSFFDQEAGRYIPNDSYLNGQYGHLSSEELHWLDEIVAIKEQLDAFTGGQMPSHRMPQFKGTFMNRVRNRGSRLNPSLYGQGIWESVKETFCQDSEDTQYGGYMTYNSKEEDMFDNKLALEIEKLNRLPLFGINKLQDMSQLSTDLFQSMLAYAGMATHYAAMNQIVDTLEVGKQVLNRRRVERKLEETRDENKSRAFNRYIKYLDKQVYGVSQRPIVLSKGIVLNKIASFLSGLSSKIFLGGNVAGGLVNLGTGFNEIVKEALAGEFFTMKDWANANIDYWKSLPANLWDTGKLDPENKVALFLKHFNVMSNNAEKQRGWFTQKSRAANFFFGECLMLPYTSGDHYMQSMSYLALANHIMLIDERGNKTSVWNAYNLEDIEYTDLSGITKKDKRYGKTLKLSGTYFKTLEDKKEYDMLKSIINEIDNASQNSGIFGPQLNFSQEQLDYINSKGWQVADVVANKSLYENELHKHTWNEDDEVELMTKAREINNRLHGIYNEQDKTTAHQYIWSNMLLAMRGYALGMIQRRFGTAKYSVALGGEVEGTMRTMAKVIASCATDEWGIGKAAQAIFLPFTNKTKQMMLDAGFSANQYANMRRNFGDFALILALMLIKMITSKPEDDDKDREQYYATLRKQGISSEVIKYMKETDKEAEEGNIEVLGIANYFASRLLREQAAYNTAIGAEDEWSNVTSLVPSGFAVVKDLWTLGTYFYGDLMYDYQELDTEYYESLRKAGISKEIIEQIRARDKEEIENYPGKEYFYQGSKSGIYEKGDPKWKRKLKMLTPYYRSTNVLYNPYEAAASFDYGRKVKN